MGWNVTPEESPTPDQGLPRTGECATAACLPSTQHGPEESNGSPARTAPERPAKVKGGSDGHGSQCNTANATRRTGPVPPTPVRIASCRVGEVGRTAGSFAQ